MESQHGLKITLIILKIFSNAFSRGHNRLFKKNVFKTYNDGIIQGLDKKMEDNIIKDMGNLFELKRKRKKRNRPHWN